MPLYDLDKSIVVLDIGSVFTKFGFTGEFAPRAILRSEVRCRRTKKVRKISDYEDSQDLYHLLVDFIHNIYFKYALVSPKDKSIVIVESLLCPTLFRETLAKVLFVQYELSSIFFVPSHLACLAPLAIDSALVLDVGYTEAVVIPICHGLPIIHAWQALPLGGYHIHSNLKTLLIDGNNGIQNLTEDVIEDIKVRCCFVTKLNRAKQLALGNNEVLPCPPVKYPIGGSHSINISGYVREKSFDFLFAEDNDHLCLSTMILDALMGVNIDLRQQLAENILIVGGTSMAIGFKSRFKEELEKQLKSNRYEKLKIKTFKFHSSPSKENYTAWLGGAIYGATELLNSKSLTRENYLKDNTIPDWANLKYNARQI